MAWRGAARLYFAETRPRVPPEREIERYQRNRARKLDADLTARSFGVSEDKGIRDAAPDCPRIDVAKRIHMHFTRV